MVPHSYTANSEALRLAHEIVSDPETRAKIKAALEEEGKPGMSALIDEAVLVARELIRLAELQRDGPSSRDSVLEEAASIADREWVGENSLLASKVAGKIAKSIRALQSSPHATRESS